MVGVGWVGMGVGREGKLLFTGQDGWPVPRRLWPPTGERRQSGLKWGRIFACNFLTAELFFTKRVAPERHTTCARGTMHSSPGYQTCRSHSLQNCMHMCMCKHGKLWHFLHTFSKSPPTGAKDAHDFSHRRCMRRFSEALSQTQVVAGPMPWTWHAYTPPKKSSMGRPKAAKPVPDTLIL